MQAEKVIERKAPTIKVGSRDATRLNFDSPFSLLFIGWLFTYRLLPSSPCSIELSRASPASTIRSAHRKPCRFDTVRPMPRSHVRSGPPVQSNAICHSRYIQLSPH